MKNSSNNRIRLSDGGKSLRSKYYHPQISPECDKDIKKTSFLRSCFGDIEAMLSSRLIFISGLCYALLNTIVVRWLLMCSIGLAFITLSEEAIHPNENQDASFNTIDIAIDSFFIFLGVLKLCSVFSHLQMLESQFGKDYNRIQLLNKFGIFDVIVATISICYSDSAIGSWVRLLRVLVFTSFAMEEMPHVEILMVGM